MPSTTTTENHSLTYPVEGATGWYATWEALAQQITDFLDDVTDMRMSNIKDSNGNESIRITTTASAVNDFTVTNAATGNDPTLTATGDDTNVGIGITAKGTGTVNVNNTVKAAVVSSAVNEVTVTNAATGNGPSVAATGTDTNIDLTLNAKGSGVLDVGSDIVPTTDSTSDLGTTAKAFANTYTDSLSFDLGTNNLDTYTVGTFTPTLDNDGAPSVTYTSQQGQYIQIGKAVIIQGRVSWSAFSGGTGFMSVTGFPGLSWDHSTVTEHNLDCNLESVDHSTANTRRILLQFSSGATGFGRITKEVNNASNSQFSTGAYPNSGTIRFWGIRYVS